MSKTLVSSRWLNLHLNDENLIILDATQEEKRLKIARKFQNLQIKGSRYFDIKNDFSDTNGRFPNTFPSKEQFEKSSQKLGINSDSIIVVYDALGIFSSPRVWWLFKIFGYEQVFVLNGGLPDWISKGFLIEPLQKNSFKKGNFKAKLNPDNVWFFNDIKDNITTTKFLVIDARSKDRFQSLVSETRKGLRSGNIPNSVNLPYTNVLRNGKFKSKAKLTELFTNFDQTKPYVFSCDSGITACILLLASELILENSLLVENTNKVPKAIYDGSWTEFGTLE